MAFCRHRRYLPLKILPIALTIQGLPVLSTEICTPPPSTPSHSFPVHLWTPKSSAVPLGLVPIIQTVPSAPMPISLAEPGTGFQVFLTLRKISPLALTIQGFPLGSTSILTPPPSTPRHSFPVHLWTPKLSFVPLGLVPIIQTVPSAPTPISLAEPGTVFQVSLTLRKISPLALTIQGSPLGSTSSLTPPPSTP